MQKETFPKSQKLVSRKLIDRLFDGKDSKAMTVFPLRLIYMVLNKDDEALHVRGRMTPMDDAQMLISVPKRCFKHAVDRNRVKRQVREAYRKHRQLYEVPEGKCITMAFIWIDRQHHDTAFVEKKVVALMQKMGKSLI